MNSISCIRAGKTIKAFGSKGSLIIVLDRDVELQENEPVFLIIDGKPVPFFIRSALEKSYGEWLTAFDGVDTPDAARRLCGLEVALPLINSPETEPELTQDVLLGYKVVDVQFGLIGKLSDVMHLPMHSLMVVRDEEKEYLIPLNETIVQNINNRKKQITIAAPEGLLGLNI
jgi:16S rRNA processing protein RimM